MLPRLVIEGLVRCGSGALTGGTSGVVTVCDRRGAGFGSGTRSAVELAVEDSPWRLIQPAPGRTTGGWRIAERAGPSGLRRQCAGPALRLHRRRERRRPVQAPHHAKSPVTTFPPLTRTLPISSNRAKTHILTEGSPQCTSVRLSPSSQTLSLG